MTTLSADVATPFGIRRGDGNTSDTSQVPLQLPQTVETLSASPLYGTIWCYRAWNGITANIEFRKDGSCSVFDGARLHSGKWFNKNKNNAIFQFGNWQCKFILSDNGKVLTQDWNGGLQRLYYPGTTPPAASHKLRDSIADTNVYWEMRNGEGTSQYVFSASGAWREYWKGEKKSGSWLGWYGNTIKFTDGEHGFFHLSEDGNTLIRYDGKRWQKRFRTNAVPINAKTASTANTEKSQEASKTSSTKVTSPQTLIEEFEALKQQKTAAFNTAFTSINQKDSRALLSLKNRIGTKDIVVLENINKALNAIEKNELFPTHPPMPGEEKKMNLFAQEFFRIFEAHDRNYTKTLKNVSDRLRTSYTNLLKRAIASGDLQIAKEIKNEMEFPAILQKIEGVYSRERLLFMIRGGRRAQSWPGGSSDWHKVIGIETLEPLRLKLEDGWGKVLRMEENFLIEEGTPYRWKKIR